MVGFNEIGDFSETTSGIDAGNYRLGMFGDLKFQDEERTSA